MILESHNFLPISSFTLSLIISLSLGKLFLHLFKKYTQSKVREFTPTTHQIKNNTPTMGGIFILLSSFITAFFFNGVHTTSLLLSLCLLLFGIIGFYDDWCKINKTRGITSLTKFLLQIGSAILIISLWIHYTTPNLTLAIPFIEPSSYPYIGFLFILWSAFVMVGTSNAVNLTDGLDGLATQSLIPNFLLVAFLATHSYHHPEISIFCYALVGSLSGFLWYNHQPARIFMGDVGSLPLGAVLALLFIMIKKEFLLPLSGIIFILETVSVILQVGSMRLRNKRIFKMAPFHHHLELSGWREKKIVHLLSLLTIINCIVLFVIYKIY